MVGKQYARMQKLALKDQLRGIVDLQKRVSAGVQNLAAPGNSQMGQPSRPKNQTKMQRAA